MSRKIGLLALLLALVAGALLPVMTHLNSASIDANNSGNVLAYVNAIDAPTIPQGGHGGPSPNPPVCPPPTPDGGGC